MKPELYLDISSEESGGSLFRTVSAAGKISFTYHHSTYDADRDITRVFETPYSSFDAFWEQLTKNREWFYLHPLFVHPDIRAFIRIQLKGVKNIDCCPQLNHPAGDLFFIHQFSHIHQAITHPAQSSVDAAIHQFCNFFKAKICIVTHDDDLALIFR